MNTYTVCYRIDSKALNGTDGIDVTPWRTYWRVHQCQPILADDTQIDFGNDGELLFVCNYVWNVVQGDFDCLLSESTSECGCAFGGTLKEMDEYYSARGWKFKKRKSELERELADFIADRQRAKV